MPVEGATRSAASVDGPAPSAAPSTSAAAPAASVELGAPPDVRVEVSSGMKEAKAVVKVGQTFGVLLLSPDDWQDEWELDGRTSLGEPLTFITRETGRELMWRIGDDKVGAHVVKVRLVQRETRAGAPSVSKRARVTVQVTR